MAKVSVHLAVFNVEPTAWGEKHDVLPSLARERLKQNIGAMVEEALRPDFPNVRVTVRT